MSNLGRLLFVYFLIAIIHIFVAVFYFATATCKEDVDVRKLSTMVFDFFTWAFYIRLFLLAYSFITISCLIQFKIHFADGGVFSLIVLFMLVIFCVLFTIFLWIHWIAGPDEFWFKKLKRVEEAFRGAKRTVIGRSYPIVYLFRANIYTFTIVLIGYNSFTLKLTILTLTQIVFLMYLGMVRPFKNWKDMTIEIVLSLFFLGTLCSLYYLDTSDDWTTITIYIYLG